MAVSQPKRGDSDMSKQLNNKAEAKASIEAKLADFMRMWHEANALIAQGRIDDSSRLDRKRNELGAEIDAIARANGLSVSW